MSVTIYHNPRCSKSRDTLALLQERIAAKTPQIRWCNRKVALLGFFELGHLPVAHDRARQGNRVGAIQGLGRHPGDFAIDLDGGWQIGGQEQVAAAAPHHQLEQVGNEGGGLIAFHDNSLV